MSRRADKYLRSVIRLLYWLVFLAHGRRELVHHADQIDSGGDVGDRATEFGKHLLRREGVMLGLLDLLDGLPSRVSDAEGDTS